MVSTDLLRELSWALVITTVIEVVVALIFRTGWRGATAVALVNLVTNPIANLLMLGISEFAPPPADSALLLLAVALEALIVLIEWRLLVWALADTVGRPRRLLALASAANVTSLVAGGFVLFTLADLWA